MVTDLKNINGLEIKELPIEIEKVGDLIYFDGPLMSVYRDQKNNPYILDWVESNDFYNRWLLYSIEKSILKSYLDKNSTHFNLINNSVNQVLFVIDKNNSGEIERCTICSPSNLPYEYLPETALKFEDEDAIGLEQIIEIFNLDQVSEKKIKVFDILEEAKKSNDELINLHIKSPNNKVGYGKIYSSILGKTLLNYSDLSTATALNIYDTKAKIPKEERPRRRKGEIKSIRQLGELEFIYAKAASFSVFLRPITKKNELFDSQTSSEKINKTIFQLFENSQNLDKLKEYKNLLNDQVLNSYQSFLKEIKDENIEISVQYANPSNNTSLTKNFTSINAKNILSNLNSLEYEKTKNVKVKGSFKALDSINATFKFETYDGDQYVGKFSEQMKPGIYKFDLQSSYQVTIEVLETKKSGKKNINEKDTLIASKKI